MQHSEQILKFKEFQKELKALLERKNQILNDMIPAVTKAILAKMDWEHIKFNSIDYSFGEIKVEVENPDEKAWHRYVFTVEPLESDYFHVDLDFREDFGKTI